MTGAPGSLAYIPEQQAPIVIFDHVTKVVSTVQTGPRSDERVAEFLATLRTQVATSGRPK